ncbi:MAG: AI-2E family transporter [Acidobacteria bacterium]|nr:AI-2E family transporter [Acidobacteriota bacterium]
MPDRELARKTLVVSMVVLGVASGGLLAWKASSIILILFAGILLAIFLRSIADAVHSAMPLPRHWAVLLTTVVLIAGTALAIWLMAPRASEQARELSSALPDAVDDLKNQLPGDETISKVIGQYERELVMEPEEIGRYVRSSIAVLTGVLVFGFVGFYLAFTPRIYEEGLLWLVPPSARGRTEEVLLACRSTLAWWLVGRFGSMAIVGAATWLGLFILGVPLALVLGIIAALFSFVPYIGPLLSAIPAILLGLAESPRTGLLVAVLYLVIQLLESYLLTPLIERRTVWLPPAMTILAQMLMGLLFGALGVIVATPLLAVIVVLVKMLLIEDRYHERVEVSRAG